jgi:hypothetical protein
VYSSRIVVVAGTSLSRVQADKLEGSMLTHAPPVLVHQLL